MHDRQMLTYNQEPQNASAISQGKRRREKRKKIDKKPSCSQNLCLAYTSSSISKQGITHCDDALCFHFVHRKRDIVMQRNVVNGWKQLRLGVSVCLAVKLCPFRNENSMRRRIGRLNNQCSPAVPDRSCCGERQLSGCLTRPALRGTRRKKEQKGSVKVATAHIIAGLPTVSYRSVSAEYCKAIAFPGFTRSICR